jgi:hypothetical protein
MENLWWVFFVAAGLPVFVGLNFYKVRKNFFGIIEIVFCAALDNAPEKKTPYKVWVRNKDLKTIERIRSFAKTAFEFLLKPLSRTP